MPDPQLLNSLCRVLDLCARWHEECSVRQRPSIILNMRDLHPPSPPGERKLHHLRNALNVRTVHNRIDGERQFQPNHFCRQQGLPLECAGVARDLIGRGSKAVLDRDLHVIQPCFHQGGKTTGRHSHGRSDQICIYACRMR
jgi:hypothetical protein